MDQTPTSPTLDVARDGRVLRLTIRNPAARNALAPEMYAAGAQALANATHDSGIGAVLLTGDGATFCAGGNLNLYGSINDGFAPPPDSPDDNGWQLVEGSYRFSEPRVIPIRDDRRYRSWEHVPEPVANAVAGQTVSVPRWQVLLWPSSERRDGK